MPDATRGPQDGARGPPLPRLRGGWAGGGLPMQESGAGASSAAGLPCQPVCHRSALFVFANWLQVKLEDIPEMGYTNADQPHPRGEVRARLVSRLFSCPASWAACAAPGNLPLLPLACWFPHPPVPLPHETPSLLVVQICVRGPIIFQGYFKDEGNTRDTIDPDGWLHTGGRGGGGCWGAGWLAARLVRH